MKLTFFGATGTVTGSCILIETEYKKILLDCGMRMGKKEEKYNLDDFKFNLSNDDVVVLSHAHLDHSGLLAKLVKEGYEGKIISTSMTKELYKLLGEDCANIIGQKTYKTRNGEEVRGKNALYRLEDVDKTYSQFEAYGYHEDINIDDNIKIVFKNSGHMSGSAITELHITENGKETVILYTGDLGNKNNELLQNPEVIKKANTVIMESTYGTRNHDLNISIEQQLDDILKNSIESTNNNYGKHKAKNLFACPAVDKIPELILKFGKVVSNNPDYKNIKFYIDSTMAIKAINLSRKNKDIYNEEAFKNFEESLKLLDVQMVREKKISEALMDKNEISVIFAGNGMLEGGKVVEHARKGLRHKEDTIVFVGYLDEDTKGFELNNKYIDNKKHIEQGCNNKTKQIVIDGVTYDINCNVVQLKGNSGHADQTGLLDFYSNLEEVGSTFIIHGSPESNVGFKDVLEECFPETKFFIPEKNESFELEYGKVTQRYIEEPEVDWPEETENVKEEKTKTQKNPEELAEEEKIKAMFENLDYNPMLDIQDEDVREKYIKENWNQFWNEFDKDKCINSDSDLESDLQTV